MRSLVSDEQCVPNDGMRYDPLYTYNQRSLDSLAESTDEGEEDAETPENPSASADEASMLDQDQLGSTFGGFGGGSRRRSTGDISVIGRKEGAGSRKSGSRRASDGSGSGGSGADGRARSSSNSPTRHSRRSWDGGGGGFSGSHGWNPVSPLPASGQPTLRRSSSKVKRKSSLSKCESASELSDQETFSPSNSPYNSPYASPSGSPRLPRRATSSSSSVGSQSGAEGRLSPSMLQLHSGVQQLVTTRTSPLRLGSALGEGDEKNIPE